MFHVVRGITLAIKYLERGVCNCWIADSLAEDVVDA